jgi:peptide/nickel transport system permease protein
MFTRFLFQKLIRAVLTLWLLLTFTFVALNATGDPARVILGPEARPQDVEQFKRIWNQDRPLYEQYVTYLANLAQGDFGQSYRDSRDADEIVFERLPKSLELNLLAFVITLLVAIPMGMTAAVYRNTFIDRGIMLLTTVGYGLPNFFLGLMLIFTFSMRLKQLPSSGSGTWQHLVLPVITLVTFEAAILARFVRSAMLEVLNQPYIRTARAKGLRQLTVLRRHALPNTAIPVITILGLRLVSYIGGSVITENVFAWPGVGRLLVQAVRNRDVAVVQFVVLLIGAAMVSMNLAIDMLYGWLDPRIRHE